MSDLRSKYESSVVVQDRLREVVSSEEDADVHPAPYLVAKPLDLPGDDLLMIAIVGPQDERRREMVRALAVHPETDIRAFPSYPPDMEESPRLLAENHDVVMVDLDADPEVALELVEVLGSSLSTTVMVYSTKADPELLVRSMRAGAREFLSPPFERAVIAEALTRAASRKMSTAVTAAAEQEANTADEKAVMGKLLPFMGAKGGTGVTTLACNFAVALAQSPNQKTLLIDLDLPLGDAALNLGIIPEYSAIHALQTYERLDSSLLSRLVVKHDSGLAVLAAPGRFQQYQTTNEAIDKLLTVALENYDFVVVDLGSRIDLTETMLFKRAFTIYLVTQAGIPELRNANRLISQFFGIEGPKLDVVINRYESRSSSVSEADITKALTRPAQWKVPNDYASVKRMQINATPMALSDSGVSVQIRRMAAALTGESAVPAKKKVFSLFG